MVPSHPQLQDTVGKLIVKDGLCCPPGAMMMQGNRAHHAIGEAPKAKFFLSEEIAKKHRRGRSLDI